VESIFPLLIEVNFLNLQEQHKKYFTLSNNKIWFGLCSATLRQNQQLYGHQFSPAKTYFLGLFSFLFGQLATVSKILVRTIGAWTHL
jgi:hypothetical protein